MNSPEQPTSDMTFTAPIEIEQAIEPVRVEKDKVIVMGVEIPRNPEPGLRTPRPERFRDFIEDEGSIPILQTIAKGIALNQPTLLEGEAAMGKSISIEYLAMLANQEVYRMSLNGQTDTSDLIGKWVPRTEGLGDQLWGKIQTLDLRPESLEILRRKKTVEENGEQVMYGPSETQVEGENGKEITLRNNFGLLDKNELQQIAQIEGIQISESDWAWQDGELPREIVNGAWTVLDEANTCEPQILVRLNSILEKGGSLMLHEDGARIPEPKDPNKTHRTFLTCNPPGGKYRGRVPFSVEFMSRLNYQNLGELPEEVEIKRFQRIMGCEAPLEADLLKDKFVNSEPIEEGMRLAEVYGKEWASDFGAKSITAFRKVREMVRSGEVCKDQEQGFEIDQRDTTRFLDYIHNLREYGNMKKTIDDAVDYCILGKFKSQDDREKVKDIVFGLIKVDEPKAIVEETKKQQETALRNLKADILAMGIPEHHKNLLMGMEE